jgi:hypothetical protein
MQKWINMNNNNNNNNNNNRLMIYQKFFKWLYHPDLSAKKRPARDIVRELPLLKRKEKTNVQAKAVWLLDKIE